MKQIPLLPYEKYLASQLGVSEEEYQRFKAIQLEHAATRPATGVRAGPVLPILINLAIGVGLSLVSSLLFPQPRQRQTQIKAKQRGGETLTSNQRASPRQGFSALQSPASIGQLVPVVIAKRENGYGGVRVNFPLIWSQLMSMRGSQMFRGIFLAGAGAMPSDAWDNAGWAFGNNTLGAYAFFGSADTEGGRFSLYYRGDGGRIEGTDLLAGRRADKDVGNAENEGGSDVYSIAVKNDEYEDAFCMVETPSTSTVFGLYGWCPNAMLYRSPTTIRPTVQARVNQLGEVDTEDDAATLCDIWKAKYHWSCRGGLIEYKPLGEGEWTEVATGEWKIKKQFVSVTDRLRYKLANNTDARTAIKFDTDNARLENNKADAKLELTAIGSGVAGIQVSADNALVPGELYRIGSAWAVLERRVPQFDDEYIFVSDQDDSPPGNGNTMEYVFIVVKEGEVHFVSKEFLNPPEQSETLKPPEYDPSEDLAELATEWEGRYRVCSGAAQIFRMGLGSVASVREVRVMEVGFRSRVGINVNGMPEYRSCPTIKKINAKAGQNQVGDDAGGRLTVSVYRSNTLTTRVKRYSCFELWYKGSSGVWRRFDAIFAIVGNNEQDFYNYLRIEFHTESRWEARFEPVSSWEIRDQKIDQIFVLDSSAKKERIWNTGDGTQVITTGYTRNPMKGKNRRIQQLDPDKDIGLGWSDYDNKSEEGEPDTEAYKSMLDGYGHFAEAFCYDNVQTSVGSQPEHEIVYVNYPDASGKVPSYECLATIGINLTASLEFTSLQQFSGYCQNGYRMRQLLAEDEVGSSHLFPDWLRELMTSNRVGPMPPLPDTQIDEESFRQAAQWCADRNYYYDAVETDPLNILQWASDIAQAHLLKLSRIGGKYYLRPAIEFGQPLQVSAMFTNGNIVESSFRLETIDYEARQPVIVQVAWREETTDVEAPLFPRERSATVRESSTPVNAPVEALDLTSWCTNINQAIDAACYLIRFRRLADHRISFQTTPDLLCVGLSVGAIIKVAIDVTTYDSAAQGVITENGTLVTTRPDIAPKADGSYPALLWGGGNDAATESQIVITDGVASPANSFFAIQYSGSSTRTYEVSSLSIGQDGVISVEAFHHPVDGNGVSLLGVDWTSYDTDATWTLQL